MSVSDGKSISFVHIEIAKKPVVSFAAYSHSVTGEVSLRTELKHRAERTARNRVRALIILYLKPEYV